MLVGKLEGLDGFSAGFYDPASNHRGDVQTIVRRGLGLNQGHKSVELVLLDIHEKIAGRLHVPLLREKIREIASNLTKRRQNSQPDAQREKKTRSRLFATAQPSQNHTEHRQTPRAKTG